MICRRSVVSFAAVLVTAIGVQTALTGAAPPSDDESTIVHVLNRIGFGPRPGDVERVRQLGVRPYIEQPLHPEHISDAVLAPRLAGFSTINLSSKEIAGRYEIPLEQARREARHADLKRP